MGRGRGGASLDFALAITSKSHHWDKDVVYPGGGTGSTDSNRGRQEGMHTLLLWGLGSLRAGPGVLMPCLCAPAHRPESPLREIVKECHWALTASQSCRQHPRIPRR